MPQYRLSKDCMPSKGILVQKKKGKKTAPHIDGIQQMYEASLWIIRMHKGKEECPSKMHHMPSDSQA